MKIKRLFCLLLVLLVLSGTVCPALAATNNQVTILFTHDLHSHLLPANDESGNSYGGYARLKTAIDAQKAIHPNALLVDGGDFSMGSLFQTVFATDAAELRIMGALGYDATTFGNHEYDYRAQGLADMLNAASESGEALPAIVEANYKPPKLGETGYGPDAEAVWAAFQNYGVQDYIVVERGGVNFAIFGIMGQDSHECAPMSGMILQDPAATAQRVIDLIEVEVPQPRVVVCLSHSGTDPDSEKSEDELLAKNTQGIDVIISGHSHTQLDEPIRVGDTYLVSAYEYSKFLGSMTLDRTPDGLALADYRLIPIDDTLTEDPAIAAKVEEYKGLVEESYLSQFGSLTFDQVLAYNPYSFESQSEMYTSHRELALGNLIADSYKWAVERALGEGSAPINLALTATGVVRSSLPTGDLTVADVYNVSSLRVGADGVPGYPLVEVWVTGKDLKNIFEVDASVQPLMPAAQLYFTGMSFTFNPHRMIFNKVTDCSQLLPDGTAVPIEDDRLYHITTGLYCGQMLGAVESQSFGILSITPRDAEGNPIENLEDHIVHNPDGTELKEWYALSSYLQDMKTVDARYSTTQGRKITDPSWNPVKLLKNPNLITAAVLAVILLVVLVIVLLVRKIRRLIKRRGNPAQSE